MKKKLITSLVLLFTASSLMAEVKEFQLRELERSIVKKEIPNCLNVTRYYDVVYCSGKVYSILDDTLNTTYTQVRKKLNKEQKNRLKKVQVKWIHHRDDTCATVKNNSVILNLSCAKRQTVESLVYLLAIDKNPQDFDKLLIEYKTGK